MQGPQSLILGPLIFLSPLPGKCSPSRGFSSPFQWVLFFNLEAHFSLELWTACSTAYGMRKRHIRHGVLHTEPTISLHIFPIS